MKKALFISTCSVITLLSFPLQSNSQQVNIYQTCTNYQENYSPGYYDAYGNYVQGNVNTQRYNVQCGTGTYYRPNGGAVYQAPVAQPGYGRGYCSPARTTLGGLLGGGIGAAVSKKSSWSWAIPLGAVLGAGAANATCY